jgi:hypothetical protein
MDRIIKAEKELKKKINSKFKVCRKKFLSWATPEGDFFKTYLNGVHKPEGMSLPYQRKIKKISDLVEITYQKFIHQFKDMPNIGTIYWRQFPFITNFKGSYYCEMRCLIKENESCHK